MNTRISSHPTHGLPRGPARLLALGLTVGLVLCAVAPADAQRPRQSRTATRASSPLQAATAAKRAGRSADRVAVELTRTYRLDRNEVARTMLRAGYESGPVGRALVRGLRTSPERAVRHLERAGVRDHRELYGATLQMTRTRPEALRVFRLAKGSDAVVAFLTSGREPSPPTAEETAADMKEAGFSIEEIIDVLLGEAYDLAADEVLAPLLEVYDTQQELFVQIIELLREHQLRQTQVLQALNDADVGTAESIDILHAAGYAWDQIADGLEWLGHSTADVIRLLHEAGATAQDIVAWAWGEGNAGVETILAALEPVGAEALAGVAAELLEEGAPALDVARALVAGGMSIEEVVQLLVDEGLAPEEIAAIMAELRVSADQMLEIMTTIVGLTHDAAMAIISNI